MCVASDGLYFKGKKFNSLKIKLISILFLLSDPQPNFYANESEARLQISHTFRISISVNANGHYGMNQKKNRNDLWFLIVAQTYSIQFGMSVKDRV